MAKILIVEDDMTSQMVLVNFVEKMGHAAFVSPHGRHAHEALLAHNEFDLIISDIMMPEMDGFELVNIIKGNSELCNLPIIMVSTVVSPTQIADVLDTKADFILPKPVDRQELENAVNRCLIGAKAL